MGKTRLVFRAPVLTASGYGVHSRQVLRSLMESGLFDISVQSVGWGQTGFIPDQDDDGFVRAVKSLAAKGEQEMAQQAQYDISVQVLIANEFTRLAPLNVGITAGIESDRVSPEWIQKVNDCIDLLVVPSVHSAQTFAEVRYASSDGKDILQLKKPIIVVHEGFDSDVFHTDVPGDAHIDESLEDQPTFNFLAVGLGLERAFGEDRKNISTLVKLFTETFDGRKDVGLVLKVGMVNSSLMDFEATKRKIAESRAAAQAKDPPKIRLVHGRLSDRQMAALYTHPKVGAMVSLTHGEGFGLPLIEAAACGLPVMATDWSGHLDFLKLDGKRFFVPFAYDLKEIPDSAVWKNVMEKGSQWAYVKEDDVKAKMLKMVANPGPPSTWAKELALLLRERFDSKVVYSGLIESITNLLGSRGKLAPAGPKEDFPTEIRKQMQAVAGGKKTLLYTMPMSAGDVYISTAIVNSLRKKFPEHFIFFATKEQYKGILDENPDIDQVVPFQDEWMYNVPLLESIFDEVYTPNTAVQLNTSNWVHGGKGRNLGDELAAQCQVEFGEYRIQTKPAPIPGLRGPYICLNPGSGKGQWGARNYLHWQEVVNNLREMTKMEVVQVGLLEDPLYTGVIDMRGKTDYNQLAEIVANSQLMVGIDSLTMHLAEGLEVPYVALFGSSYATSTGPRKVAPISLRVLMETPSRYTCAKACYKYTCTVDPGHPCINEIKPRDVVWKCLDLVLNVGDGKRPYNLEGFDKDYKEFRPTISGYTHTLNPEQQGFPYLESIRSMLGFCDEVVVVDGGSDDGSLQKLQELVDKDNRLKIINRKWDWDEPGMDGMQKAFGRGMCQGDFLWQQDADEVVHEDDYDKIKDLVKRFPADAKLLSLPIVELWGLDGQVRTDRHSWKWRLSRNDFRITHGIHKDARVFDKETGRTYAKKGMSDGCEYIDIMTGEYFPHKSFYTSEMEDLRRRDPAAYGDLMNQVFGKLPSVFHYSWADIPRKVRNFREFWDKCWANIYNEPERPARFPGVETDEQVIDKASELLLQGGEHEKSQTFKLTRSLPKIMEEWTMGAKAGWTKE